MFKLLCVLECVILVSSNPLQVLSSCPVILYQRTPELSTTQATNYQPYLQQHTAQNQLAPSQTIPYLYSDQILGLYLDNVLTNTANSYVDANVVYDQNGFDVARYISSAAAIPNVVNNYIILPPDYLKLNQSTNNAILSYNKYDNIKPQDQYNYIVKSKDDERIKHNNNNIINVVSDKTDSVVSNGYEDNRQVKKKKKKKRKKFDKENDIDKSSNTLEGDEKQKSNKTKGYKSKKSVDDNIDDTKVRQDNEDSKKPKKGNKKTKKKRKQSANNNNIEPIPSDFYNEGLKAANLDVCFDINEDCASLDSRKTRNNCYEPRNSFQQYNPMDFSANIAAYLNSFMSNQYGANYFNPYGNFPFNFNYLYQLPQQTNTRSNNSNKKRKNKNKKQQTNNNNSNTVKLKITKSQDEEVTSNDCNNIVELAPEFIEVDTMEPTTSNTPDVTTNSEQDEEIDTINTEPNVEFDITEPTVLHPIDEKETLHVAPKPDQEIPLDILNYNDFADEYYPDFRSDNIYVSKEDYESNFHNRHYYTSDSEAEMSREKRRYERIDGTRFKNLNTFNNKHEEYIGNGDKSRRKDSVNNIDSIERKFCTPPPLEFPDFKTKMINKHRYISRDDIYHKTDDENYIDDYEISYEDMKEGKNYDIHKNDDSGVETVFAHSKVVRYGSKPTTEEPMIESIPMSDEDRNLFSRDGDTTFVIARSLGYPDEY